MGFAGRICCYTLEILTMGKHYASPHKSVTEDFVEFYELELQLVLSELTDTLSPSIISSEACQIVLQLMIQNAEYIKKNGKSEKANANAKQLKRLFELVSKFNEFTSNMNTLQLQNKEFYSKMIAEKIKNVDIQKKLDAIKSAEEWN